MQTKIRNTRRDRGVSRGLSLLIAVLLGSVSIAVAGPTSPEAKAAHAHAPDLGEHRFNYPGAADTRAPQAETGASDEDSAREARDALSSEQRMTYGPPDDRQPGDRPMPSDHTKNLDTPDSGAEVDEPDRPIGDFDARTRP